MAGKYRVLPETWPLMDDYLRGQISRAEYLTGYINFFRNNFKKDFPYIDEWIEDKDGFVSFIANEATPEICAQSWNSGLLGKVLIKKYAGDPFQGIKNQKHDPYHWAILARLIYDDLESDLKRFIDESGPIMPYLGFSIIRAAALERANVDSRKYKTLAPLLLRHGNDPYSSTFIGEFKFVYGDHGSEPYPIGGALGEMFQYAHADFASRNNTPIDSSIAADINYHIGLHTMKDVPTDTWDAMIEAMKGNENMKSNNIVRKAVDYKIKEYNRENKNKKARKKESDSIFWGWEDRVSIHVNKEGVSFESQEKLSSIKEMVEKTKNTKDGEIIYHRLEGDDETFRGIEESTGIPKSTVGNRLKKLRDLYLIEPEQNGDTNKS